MSGSDELDRRILSLVQQNNRLTTSEIGERVGLSKSSVQRRLATLRSDGTIMADVAVANPAKVGTYLSFVLLVTLVTDRPETMKHFADAVNGSPEVQQCYHVTGPADFVLIVNVRDQDHFAEITRVLLYDNPDVSRFETCLIIERAKIGLALPVE